MRLFDEFGDFVGDLDVGDPGDGVVGCILGLAIFLTFAPFVVSYLVIVQFFGGEEADWFRKLLAGLIAIPVGFTLLMLGMTFITLITS